jgi:hypothetical protein
MQRVDDSAGPTAERYRQAHGFFTIIGRSRSQRRVSMLDDALGRAWMRSKISGDEYSALRRYALHWLAGGLQGPMCSVDPNRIFAFDPAGMSGLAKTERQQDHRDAYRAARGKIGARHPEIAFVADQIACYDYSLLQTGLMLGYHSAAHARDAARKLLRDAGDRLLAVWKDRDR